MIIISCVTAISGPLSDILYVRDWWSPSTITSTPIGIESVLVGFMIGGIASVAYENVFKKRLHKSLVSRLRQKQPIISRLALIFLAMSLIFFGAYFIVGLNSLLATLIPMALVIGFIYYKRADLISDSIVSGFILVIIASIVYSFLNILTPGWLQVFWHFNNTPPAFFIGLPIDDVLWYLFAGALIGPLYEFLQKARLINIG